VERHLIVFPLPTCIRQWTDARNDGCLRVLRGDLTDGRRLTLDSGKRWGILLIVDSDIIERTRTPVVPTSVVEWFSSRDT
jgi:hypothetical protein